MLDFQKLATNFSFLVFGEAISKIFTFIAFAYLARTFGPLEFGHLEFVLAVMIFATLLVDFGSNPLGSREIAKTPYKIGEIVASIIGMRIILAVIAFCLLFVFMLIFLWGKPQLKILLLLYGLSLFFVPFFFQFVFQGLEKMNWVAACSVVRQVVFAGGVFILISNFKRIWLVALIEIIAVIALALFGVYVLVFHVKAANFKTDIRKLWATFKMALPIGLSDITWAFMWYFATVLLGLLTVDKEVGWFSAAHRPVMTLHTFVWLYFCNLLPTISRSTNQPKEILDDLMRYSMSFLSWATVFLGVVGLTMAEPLMVLVFGDQFRESANVIKILIWMIPLSSLGCHYRYILIGYERQKYEFIAHVFAAVISIVMGFILIPVYAEKGAAFSLITAITVYCIFVYFFVKIYVRHVPFLPYIYKPILVGSGMIGLFFALNTYKLWSAICASVIFYFLAMIILQPEIRKIPIMIFSKQNKN
jgi:O-antigen/teichoic acid export membrane protein